MTCVIKGVYKEQIQNGTNVKYSILSISLQNDNFTSCKKQRMRNPVYIILFTLYGKENCTHYM